MFVIGRKYLIEFNMKDGEAKYIYWPFNLRRRLVHARNLMFETDSWN